MIRQSINNQAAKQTPSKKEIINNQINQIINKNIIYYNQQSPIVLKIDNYTTISHTKNKSSLTKKRFNLDNMHRQTSKNIHKKQRKKSSSPLKNNEENQTVQLHHLKNQLKAQRNKVKKQNFQLSNPIKSKLLINKLQMTTNSRSKSTIFNHIIKNTNKNKNHKKKQHNKKLQTKQSKGFKSLNKSKSNNKTNKKQQLTKYKQQKVSQYKSQNIQNKLQNFIQYHKKKKSSINLQIDKKKNSLSNQNHKDINFTNQKYKNITLQINKKEQVSEKEIKIKLIQFKQMINNSNEMKYFHKQLEQITKKIEDIIQNQSYSHNSQQIKGNQKNRDDYDIYLGAIINNQYKQPNVKKIDQQNNNYLQNQKLGNIKVSLNQQQNKEKCNEQISQPPLNNKKQQQGIIQQLCYKQHQAQILETKKQNKDIFMSLKSPKNNQLNLKKKYEQIYPKTSPRFNQLQLNDLLSLKQKNINSKHNKMSLLVDKLFQKNIVSPKSHQLQINIVKQRHKYQYKMLENFKKQAQKLKILIQDINKSKKQIQDISQLIKEQKWNKGFQFIKIDKQTQICENKKNPIKLPFHQQQNFQRQFILINKQQKYYQNQFQLKLLTVKSQQSSKLQQQYYINFFPSQQDNQLNQKNKIITIKCQEPLNQQQVKNDLNLFRIISIQQNKQLSIQLSRSIPIQSSSIKIQDQQRVEEKIKPFQTNLYFLKQYCIALCQFVKENSIKKKQFIKNISSPLTYNLSDFLKSYRTSLNGIPCTYQNLLDDDLQYLYFNKSYYSNSPISIKSFQQFNLIYKNISYNKIQNSSALDRLIQTTFLKSIYQALNQAFIYERPGSIYGMPLPWVCNSNYLKNNKNIFLLNSNDIENKSNQFEIIDEILDEILGRSIARVIQWSSYLCGFISDTLDLKDTLVDEQYVINLRQNRMTILLEKLIVEDENKMNQTQPYRNQILLKVGEKLFKSLINQVTNQMKFIERRSILRSVDY